MSTHLCEHDKDGVELLESSDEALPPTVTIHECPQCGMWAEYDTETDEYRPTI